MMNDSSRKTARRKRPFYFLLLFVIIGACVLCFYGLTLSSTRLALNSSTELNRMYLREMTDQIIGHFDIGLNSRFSLLRTIASSISEEDTANESSLFAFLKTAESEAGFPVIAFLDEDGMCYSRDGVRPAASRLSFLADLLKGKTNLISCNEALFDQDMIVIGVRIEPRAYGNKTFIGILAGFSGEDFNDELSVQDAENQIYPSIVTGEGSFIAYTTFNSELPRGNNIFSKMDIYAEFEEGYSLEKMKSDFAEGNSGMTIFTATGRLQCMYYSPVEGMDWFVLLELPYEVIDDLINHLTRDLYRNSILALLFILLIIFALFFIYLKNIRNHARELIAAKASAEEARKKAEDASRAKTEFLSRMSHELRTPMNGIIGMTAIARNNLNDTARVADCLKKVSLSSQHMLALVNDVLDMSKVENNRIELKFEYFDMRTFLENLDAVYRAQAEEKGLRFETIPEGPIDAQLVGDTLHLNQILSNLLSNAIKFTEQGCVTLRAAAGERKEKQLWLRFQVTDTGAGIRKENLEKIFQPFEQENSEISWKYGGTGLGLSIVKKFTEMMGGHVGIESVYGQGSTFTVELPLGLVEGSQLMLWGDPQSEEEANPATEYDFKGKRILLAEDNELNREIAMELLGEATGAELTPAEDGREAVDIFAGSKHGFFDLILMDLQMPNMNGYEAARAIRAMNRPDAASIPILALTANAFAEDAEKCFQAGMNAHLSKPLDVAAVYAAMNEILARRAS